MACVHLRRLYQLCQDEGVRMSGGDLIHVVCQQCGIQEVCPSLLLDGFEAQESKPTGQGDGAQPSTEAP